MKKTCIALLFCFVSLFSCKNNGENTSKENETNVEEIKKEDFFKVQLNLKVLKNDNLHLYYTEDGSINFNEKQSIWTEVKGSSEFQTVSFNFPKDAIPTAIRLDLGYGKNAEQSDVELGSIEMSYFGKNFKAQGAEIFNYFYPTAESSTRLAGTNTLKRIDKNQPGAPILYPNENLSKKISEIVKK